MTFHQIVLQLLSAVVLKLDTTVAKAPPRQGVVPGAIAWDSCDADTCGQLAVSIGRIYLSERPPAELEASVPCDPPYAVGDIIVQVIRCAPSPQGNELAPPMDKLTTTAETITTDAIALLDAVSCRLIELENSFAISGRLVRESAIRGPEGGCVGAELSAAVWVVRGVI